MLPFTTCLRVCRLLLPPLASLLAGPGLAQTTTFAYTGSPQTYTVPAGVTRLAVVATGASGGLFSDINYGYGAIVQATVTVLPGEVLTVVVGGPGSQGSSFNAGGFNGGGTGADNGGGGGATDLRRASSNPRTDDYLASRNALLVAGGGGGSDFFPYAGGHGGTPVGGDGASSGMGIGYGATLLGAGDSQGAERGRNELGGAGNGYGGGGGGGYYGGGGGGNAVYAYSGGGGGSSFVSPTGSSAISYRVATTAGPGALALTPASAPLATAPSLNAATVAMYPNPTSAGFTVVVPGVAGAAYVQLDVLNALGQVVRQQAAVLPTTGTQLTCPTQGLTPGVYLVRVAAGGALLTQRLLVQ